MVAKVAGGVAVKVDAAVEVDPANATSSPNQIHDPALVP